MLSIEISDSVTSGSYLNAPDKQENADNQAISNNEIKRSSSSNSVSVSSGIDKLSIPQSNTKPNLEKPTSTSNLEAAAVAETEEALNEVLKKFRKLMKVVEDIFDKHSLVSSGAFAALMTELIAELGSEQIELKLTQLQTLKAQNEQLMKENQEKIEQAEDSAKEAKKSNTVNTILGVLGAILGAILAPITGGIFGILLGAAACAGFCSAIVNNDAVQKTMDADTANILGKFFMGLEFATMIASALVGGGALIAGKFAASTRPMLQKIGQQLQQSSKLTEGMKTFANTASAVDGVANGASEAVASGMEAKVLYAEADMHDTKADLEQLQNLQDRLRGQLRTIMEQFETMVETLLRMISQSGDSLQELLKRRTMV